MLGRGRGLCLSALPRLVERGLDGLQLPREPVTRLGDLRETGRKVGLLSREPIGGGRCF